MKNEKNTIFTDHEIKNLNYILAVAKNIPAIILQSLSMIKFSLHIIVLMYEIRIWINVFDDWLMMSSFHNSVTSLVCILEYYYFMKVYLLYKFR